MALNSIETQRGLTFLSLFALLLLGNMEAIQHGMMKKTELSSETKNKKGCTLKCYEEIAIATEYMKQDLTLLLQYDFAR